MGGFIDDPFVTPAPAWPQDLAAFAAGSSWSGGSGSGASSSLASDSADLEFHRQNGSSSSALLNGGGRATREAAVVSSPLELHEQQLLQQQRQLLVAQHGLDFEVERALMMGGGGTLVGSVLSAPVLCGSNDDSSVSEETTGLPPQFLLAGEQQAPPAWSSAFSQISPLVVGEETPQSFGFGTLGSCDLLHEACAPDGKRYPQLGNVPLQLHDDVKTGKILSFAPGQQLDTNFDDLQIGQKEFSGLHHLNLFSLVSGQLSAFNATGAALRPKQVQSNEVRSGANGLSATSMARSEAPNGNFAAGNGAPNKPRFRARRGQATDPHSIAERLRREKISDRMKNLQELVPNSNRTDKASMLDEIIDYVKFLQLQVKVLSMSRLGATEAVVPLLTESQNDVPGLLTSPKPGSSRVKKAGGDVLEQPELRDGAAFEQEVVQLMENNMTTAMQYLQSKGLCLMPIALASAISDQKGTSSEAVRPGTGDTADDDDGSNKGGVKKVPDAMKPFGVAKEMRSRA